MIEHLMDSSQFKTPLVLILLFGLGAIVVALLVLDDRIPFLGGGGSEDDDPISPTESIDASLEQGGARSVSAGSDRSDGFEPLAGGEAAMGVEAVDPFFLTSVVKGSVVDAQGRTLPSVLIRIESTLPGVLSALIPGGRYEASAESGPEGSFSIRLPAEGAFRLSASKENYATFFVNLVLPGDDLTITLATGAALAGEVLDRETSRPVADALVCAQHSFQVIEARTDEAGRFRLVDLPEGLMSIQCFHDGYDLERHDGIRLSKDSDNFVSVELRPAGDIEGSVMALATREPLAGASVSYAMRTWGADGRRDLVSREARTDEKGRFLFESVSRRGYRLEANAEGYTTGIPEPLDLARGEERTIEIYLKQESVAAGRVLDPGRRPASGARVIVLKSTRYGERTLESETDEKGLFRIAGIEGGIPFSLVACSKDSAPGLLDKLMVAQGGMLEDLEIRLQQPASISGIAYGPDQNPLPAARVTLDGIKGILMRYNDAVPMTNTDSEGRFSFSGLAGGKYTLAASKGILRSDASEIFLQEADDYEATLALSNGTILRGEVFDLDGAPLDDVLITAIDFTVKPPDDPRKKAAPRKSAQPQRGKAKPSGGKARPSGGKARPSAKRESKKPDPAPPSNGPGRQPGSALGQRIKRALDSRGERNTPLEFEIARKLGFSRFRGNARTDETGSFCLSGLRPDDNLILSFKRYGYDTEVLTDISPEERSLSAVLSPRVALMGQVIDYAASTPVQRFRVEWMLVGADFRSTDEIIEARRGFRGPSRNFGSEDGTFHIDDMEPGEIIMRVTAKGYRASEPRRFVMASGYGVPFLTFSLDRGGSIQGRIAAGNGSPVVRVPVYMRPWVKETRGKGKKKPRVRTVSRHSDDKGRFSFTDIDEGVYEILVGDVKKPVVDPVRIKLGQGRNVSKTITLRNLGEVEVRVRGQGGVSCQAEVEIKGGPGRLTLRKVTGNLGITSFPNLLAGKYSLKIKAKGYKPFSEALSVKEGKEFKREIELQVNEK